QQQQQQQMVMSQQKQQEMMHGSPFLGMQPNIQTPIHPSETYGNNEYYGQQGYQMQISPNAGMADIDDAFAGAPMPHTSESGMDSYYGHIPQQQVSTNPSRQTMPYGFSSYGYTSSQYGASSRHAMPTDMAMPPSPLVDTDVDAFVVEKDSKGHQRKNSSSSGNENAGDSIMDLNLGSSFCLTTFGYRTVQTQSGPSGSSIEGSGLGLNGTDIHTSTLDGEEERDNEADTEDSREKVKDKQDYLQEKEKQETSNDTKSRNNLYSTTVKSNLDTNGEEQKLLSTTDTGKSSTKHSTEKTPPIWFHQGFELYKTKYNPNAGRADFYWARYLYIKGQQWNNQLYYKKMQSGDAAVRSMPPPPRIQLRPEEHTFFGCIEYCRKRAKNRHPERDQQMMFQQQQQQQQQQMAGTMTHSQSSQMYPLYHSRSGTLNPVSTVHQQNNGATGSLHPSNIPTGVGPNERSRTFGQTTPLQHSPPSHIMDPNTGMPRSMVMPVSRMMHQPMRQPTSEFARSPGLSPVAIGPSIMGTSGSAGADLYYGQQSSQYQRAELMNHQHIENHPRSMSPIIGMLKGIKEEIYVTILCLLTDPSGNRTQFPNTTAQQQMYSHLQRQGNQNYHLS
ncbi:hypothetical protein RFI_08340, partial [Reticulomyxa filosa]